MLIYVNSIERDVPEGATVKNLVELLALGQKSVAIEVNTELVTKGEWAASVLKPDDRVEIVTFVGGG